MRISRNLLCLVALASGASLPGTATADPSSVVQTWRTGDGWLTELRQHTNGARVCVTGKGFKVGHPFGISIVRSGEVTLITVVDEKQPPKKGGEMTFSSADNSFGAFPVIAEGPAYATSEGDSRRVRQMIAGLRPGPLFIAIAERKYQADLAGIDEARVQLATCESQAGTR